MADTTSTFSVLLRLRDELSAALGQPISALAKLQAATKGSAVVLDQFGRPAAAAGAALENVGKKAADLGNTKLADLRRGAAATTQITTGMLGAFRALPPGLSAATSSVNGLLGAFAAGFGPLGIAVAAITTVAGLAYALSEQLTPAARTAQQVLATTASAAERVAKIRLGSLSQGVGELGKGYDQDLAATRQRLELQQRLDQARLAARAATVRGDTTLTDEQRAARLAAEDLSQRTEGLRAQLEIARAEEDMAKGRLDTLRQIVEQQKEQARAARAASAGFSRTRETVDEQIEAIRPSYDAISNTRVYSREQLAEIKRLEKLKGTEGDAEQQRLERMATAEADAATNLKAELDGAAEAYKRAATARTQLEQAAPNLLAAQASEIHATNAAQQEQLRLAAQSRARAEEQLALDRRLAAIAQERAETEADRFISAEDKQNRLNRLLDQENALLQEKIAKLDTIIAAEKDPALRLELTRDRDQTAGRSATNRGERAANEPLDAGDTVRADLISFADSFGTKAQRAAALFTGPIKAGIEAARNGMQALLGSTDYWSAKLGNIAGPVMGALTGAIADMFAGWIAGIAAKKAASIAASAAETVASIPSMIAASISSFGLAAVIGLAAVAGIIASFETGGPIRGGRQLIQVNENGQEFVMRAPAVDRFGESFMEQLNAGILNLAALPEDVSVAMPRASGGRGSAQSPNSQLPTSSSAQPTTLNASFAVINTRAAYRDFMRREGNKMAHDYATKRTVRA